MIKWTTEVINLIAAIVSMTLVVGVAVAMVFSFRRDRRTAAAWMKRTKEMEEAHRKFMARAMGLPGEPPAAPPEN